MKFAWWMLAVVATLILTVGANTKNHENQQILTHKTWLNSTEANKKIKAIIKQKKYNIATVIKHPPEEESKTIKDCKSIAKLQCGCHFITSFDKTLKEPYNNLTFTKICKFRESMFQCLANVSKTNYVECRHLNVKLLKSKSSFSTHMKEIIKVLLKTRECVTRIEAVPETSKKEKPVRLNASFCTKLEIKPKKSVGPNSKQNKPKKTKKVAKKAT